MRPLYAMPETFLPSRIFFLQHPPTLARARFPRSFFFFFSFGAKHSLNLFVRATRRSNLFH